MATNNYFGFAHGGTQYSTPTGTGYQTAQTSYSVTPSTTYPAATRTGQTAYDNFQGTHTTTAYGFGTRPQEPAQPPPPATNQTYESFGYNRAGIAATTYDGTKAFFQQSQGTYTGGTDSQYTAGSTYSGYDAALYSAATMYVQQQQGSANSAGKGGAGSWSFKKPGMKMNKPKAPPKPQQLHYCDVCKISCAGPQTYREHLEGQKHKKKEAALKGGPTTPLPRGTNSLRCELCDVTCTGSDAYAAHIRGAKHQKVVKLHTRLGKPIPSTEPTVIGTASGTTTSAVGKSTSTSPNLTNKLASGANATAVAGSAMPAKKVIIAPKINFIGGTKLNTTGGGGGGGNCGVEAKEMKVEEITEEMKMEVLRMEEKDVQPVGQEYIEEIKNDEGKVISFQCKLCECRFNDPNAKEMHMKGRRHRLQYKKKVNPDLVVDIKPSLRQRKLQEEKVRRRQQLKDEFLRRREEDRWREEMRMMEEEERIYWEERRRYEEEMEHYEWVRRFGRTPGAMPPPPRPFPGNPPNMPPMMMRRPDTSDDRHVLAKHAQIYPMEDELQAVQKIVSNCEKALKGVSDSLTDSETLKKEEMVKIKSEPVEGEDEKKEAVPPRLLKGVMRVGLLAKGLLLKGDIRVDLVVLCSEKPTGTLLRRVAELLPKHLNAVTEEKYHVELHITQSAIVATALAEPKAKVTITLTSPIMREVIPMEATGECVNVKDPPDVLDRQKCLDALAALRHAKWFQARASNLQPCVMIIRIMRDLCQRVPTWTALDNWAMELLVEKVLASGGHPFSPGDALRRVLEAIASGVILPGGPGLLDPCEKEPTDATANMTRQEKEDITASAQHALRLVAFRQIHKVLGMDPLPVPKFPKGRFTRKRRRDNSGSEGNEGDGKKDKKDEGEMDTQDGAEGKQVPL